MTETEARASLSKYIASKPSYIKSSQQMYQKFGGWINKYKGGFHAGVISSVIYMESNGKQGTVGDASLGEIGLMQIAEYLPKALGMAPSTRLDAETNIFLGCAEYNWEAARFKFIFPEIVVNGSEDQWMLARLAFSIGHGGTVGLIKAASKQGLITRGRVYEGIERYVSTGGATALGSQSAWKVWLRVMRMRHQFDIGKAAVNDSFRAPVNNIPAPPTSSYRMPSKDVAFGPSEVAGMGILAILFLAGVGTFIYKRIKK